MLRDELADVFGGGVSSDEERRPLPPLGGETVMPTAEADPDLPPSFVGVAALASALRGAGGEGMPEVRSVAC